MSELRASSKVDLNPEFEEQPWVVLFHDVNQEIMLGAFQVTNWSSVVCLRNKEKIVNWLTNIGVMESNYRIGETSVFFQDETTRDLCYIAFK